jgi:DKNYY family
LSELLIETDGALYIQQTYPETDNSNNPIVPFTDADFASFRIFYPHADGFGELDCTYSADNAHVFYKGEIIPGADPQTFGGLGVTDISHDNNAVYMRTVQIGTLQGSTARVLMVNSGAGTFYIDDGRQVYYIFGGSTRYG